MTFNFAKSRAAWRKVATTSHSVTVAGALAKRSLIQMDTATPRLAFDAAMAAAKPLRDIDWEGTGKGGGHTWATLDLLGVQREEVPDILAACGISEEEIAEAIKTPEGAFRALRKAAEAYHTPEPYNPPSPYNGGL